MNSEKKAAPAKAKAAKMGIVQLKKLLNSNFRETDVKIKLGYAQTED